MSPSKPDDRIQASLRQLPGVDTLLKSPAAQQWLAMWPRPVVVEAIREALAAAREDLQRGGEPRTEPSLLAAVDARLQSQQARTLRPLINATGVVLHTNLGRAPLSAQAVQAVAEVAAGYSNLEYDLATGSRGSRHLYGEDLLRQITGAEAAMVVNNNAAAVLLVLSALCSGREVIISRGELIEIGGAFRIPDVMEQSGCMLREVGTTNRTHLRDYEQAIGEQTVAILKVHTSNYRIEGFTRSVEARQLAELCQKRGVLLLEDLGSGVLLDTEAYGLGPEPQVGPALRVGCDLVTFSGDKLLGGPQAGLIAGRADLVEACRRHPLARALRVDKMTLAALQATLQHYLRGEERSIPLWDMLGEPVAALMARVQRLAEWVRTEAREKAFCEAIEVQVPVGGGSLPGRTLTSAALAIDPVVSSAQALSARLRMGDPPIIGRLEGGRFLLDLRTVPAALDEQLAQQLIAALHYDTKESSEACTSSERPVTLTMASPH